MSKFVTVHGWYGEARFTPRKRQMRLRWVVRNGCHQHIRWGSRGWINRYSMTNADWQVTGNHY